MCVFWFKSINRWYWVIDGRGMLEFYFKLRNICRFIVIVVIICFNGWEIYDYYLLYD